MRPVVDLHLAGTTTPEAQAAISAHIPTCAECLAAVQSSAQEDLHEAATPPEGTPILVVPPVAAPIVEPEPQGVLPGPVRALVDTLVFGGIAVVVAVAMIALPDFFAPDEDVATDRKVGAGITISEVRIARVRPDGRKGLLAGNIIAPKDRLAFAYVHTSTWERLLVFVIDEKNEIYWQVPEWTDHREPAYAPTILNDRQVQQLPVAVHRDWQGKALAVHTIFTRDFVTTRQVEEKLADPARDKTKPLFDNTLERITLVTVDPAAERVSTAPQDDTELDPYGSETPDKHLRVDPLH